MNQDKIKVIISSGHGNFHLLFTAAEMAKRGKLSMLITGAFPTATEKTIFSKFGFQKNRKLQRFLNRQEEIPYELMGQSRFSEVVSSIGLFLRGKSMGKKLDESLQKKSFDMFGRRAAKLIHAQKEPKANVYHFRAGFGQSSIVAAREQGMKIVCDHSIVHPALLEPLVKLKGKFPETRPANPTGFWSKVVDDINAADVVVVNSEFVAETFRFMGFDSSRIRVAYQGVEDKFMSCLPGSRDFNAGDSNKPLRLLFAGGINDRKGVEILQQAFTELAETHVELHLAGALTKDNEEKFQTLLEDERVHYHGILSQVELANLMSSCDVFVFPTFAEGSARVVFEAMAAGCAVVTTPNAGSVLKDGEGGRLIPPGDKAALMQVILEFVTNSSQIAEMGQFNLAMICDSCSQKHYGDQVEATYVL